jgi:hypothetical protein
MVVNVGLQLGSSATAASNSNISNPSATVNGSVPFTLELLLSVDSTSKKLNGQVIGGFIGSTLIAQAATTQLSNVEPDRSGKQLRGDDHLRLRERCQPGCRN